MPAYNLWLHKNSPGKLLCSMELLDEYRSKVLIEHADPLVWIGSDMVHWAASGYAVPRVTLTRCEHSCSCDAPRVYGACLLGSTIRFHGDNRDVLYQLTSWADDDYLGYYIAQWPD
jgi:hypothetical protein